MPTTKKPAKKTVTKAPAKKTVAKKTAKKAPAKKTAAKKTAKKAPAKKTAKKAPAKKVAKKTAKKTAKKASSTTKVRVRGTRHDPPVLLLVHLPMNLAPAARAEKFEGPLEMALDELGTITGAGTALDEEGQPTSCDIEVEVNDVARALPIVRRVLVEGGAVKGTLVARMAANADAEIEVLLEL
jgi:hypothetical protein